LKNHVDNYQTDCFDQYM